LLDADYEERMMAMLTDIKPDTPIMSTPEQTLIDFIRVIREELKEFHAKKIEGEKKDREIERMGKKIFSLEGEIVDKEREMSQRIRKWESTLSEMTLAECKSKEDSARLEKAHESILAQLT
jgi:predicted RNase H-like nuclease (RuvC/YqgF family)